LIVRVKPTSAASSLNVPSDAPLHVGIGAVDAVNQAIAALFNAESILASV
jgi:hypothetical protein